MNDNPDLDLDPTMWIPVPNMPTRFPPGLADDVDDVIRAFRKRQSEQALAAARARRDARTRDPKA